MVGHLRVGVFPLALAVALMALVPVIALMETPALRVRLESEIAECQSTLALVGWAPLFKKGLVWLRFGLLQG